MSRGAAVWRSLLGLCLAAAAQVQAAGPDDATERSRIERDRQEAQARYRQAEQACAQRFQATDCLAQARAERRQRLDQLHREQVVLDDARRRARTAERLQGQERRRREREAQALLAAPAAAHGASASAVPAPSDGHGAAVPGDAMSQRRPTADTASVAVSAASAASAAAAARALAAQQRQARAASHADAVRQRNAAQDARRPPAAPLPVPGASAAARP